MKERYVDKKHMKRLWVHRGDYTHDRDANGAQQGIETHRDERSGAWASYSRRGAVGCNCERWRDRKAWANMRNGAVGWEKWMQE